MRKTVPLQGYLAHKKRPPPLESPWVPRHRAIAGSYGGVFLMSQVSLYALDTLKTHRFDTAQSAKGFGTATYSPAVACKLSLYARNCPFMHQTVPLCPFMRTTVPSRPSMRKTVPLSASMSRSQQRASGQRRTRRRWRAIRACPTPPRGRSNRAIRYPYFNPHTTTTE